MGVKKYIHLKKEGLANNCIFQFRLKGDYNIIKNGCSEGINF